MFLFFLAFVFFKLGIGLLPPRVGLPIFVLFSRIFCFYFVFVFFVCVVFFLLFSGFLIGDRACAPTGRTPHFCFVSPFFLTPNLTLSFPSFPDDLVLHKLLLQF